jgi:hypothetical protein
MSRPGIKKSNDGATATGAGESHFTRAHTAVGVLVVAQNLDAANDTLEVVLEAGYNYNGSDYFTPLLRRDDTEVSLTVSEMTDNDSDGTYTGMVWESNAPVEQLRARISAFTDNANGDLSVDTYVVMSNNASGGGHSFEEDSN